MYAVLFLMSKTRCNFILIVTNIIMCINNYQFCWQLLLGQLLSCLNDYYVLKITDILMSVFCNIIKHAWIL